jgi:alpha-beta hydrolase superfamily lysophospholipase
MQATRFLLDRDDGAKIQVYRWAPDGAPKAAVQITHGMCEHAGRYERLARALTAEGYLVCASDHPGHGPSAAKTDLGHLADQDGWRKCLDDLWAVNRRLAADALGAKIILFAHSFGSFMGQQFIAEHGEVLAGAVLSSSNGRPPAILPIARLVARFERWRLGPRGRSPILAQMLFGQYNKPFYPTRTDFDWLSRDVAEVDKYVADPLCGFPFTTQFAIDFLDALGPIANTAMVARVPKALPIYILSGSRDPVRQQIAKSNQRLSRC